MLLWALVNVSPLKTLLVLHNSERLFNRYFPIIFSYFFLVVRRPWRQKDGIKSRYEPGSCIMRKVNDSIIYNLTARPETSGRIPGMVPDT